jgi:hypothetical protein
MSSSIATAALQADQAAKKTLIARHQWSHGFIASQLDEMHERAGDDIQDLLASPERMEQAL